MSNERDLPLREYVGMIWVEDQPGVRLKVMASSLEEARELVIDEYGDGHVISLWHEGDASWLFSIRNSK